MMLMSLNTLTFFIIYDVSSSQYFRGDNTREPKYQADTKIFAVTTHATKLSKMTLKFHGDNTREPKIIKAGTKTRG